MRKVRVAVFVLAALMVSSGLSACGKKENKGEVIETYSGAKDIDALRGVLFSIPQEYVMMATAITEINNNSNLSDSVAYTYNNGLDQYLYFKMDKTVIVGQRATDFHFNESETKAECFEKSGILNTWLAQEDKKKFDYIEESKGNTYKIIGTATAQTVITNNLFGDFVGKVASITDGETEWSIFVGVPGTEYDDVEKEDKEIIDHIAKSLRPDNRPKAAEQEYEISMGGDDYAGEGVVDDYASGEGVVVSEKSDDAQEVTVEIVNIGEDEKVSDNSPDDGVEVTVIKKDEQTDKDPNTGNTGSEGQIEDTDSTTDPPKEEQTEPAPKEEDKSDTQQQSSDTDEPSDEEVLEALQDIVSIEILPENPNADEVVIASTVTSKEDTHIGGVLVNPAASETTGRTNAEIAEEEAHKAFVMSLDNQNKQEPDRNNVRKSDIYSMLEIGDTGRLLAKSSTGAMELCTARIDAIYLGMTALRTLAKFNGIGEVPQPPTGCAWQVVVCTIDYEQANTHPYVNMKITGMDGEKLKYLGVPYSTKTYDLFGRNSGTGQYMYYYAVPIGCKNYCLIFGSNSVESGDNAYFRIRLP